MSTSLTFRLLEVVFIGTIFAKDQLCYIRAELTIMMISWSWIYSCLLLLFTVPQGGSAPDVRGVQAEDRGALHSFCPQMDDLRTDQMWEWQGHQAQVRPYFIISALALHIRKEFTLYLLSARVQGLPASVMFWSIYRLWAATGWKYIYFSLFVKSFHTRAIPSCHGNIVLVTERRQLHFMNYSCNARMYFAVITYYHILANNYRNTCL